MIPTYNCAQLMERHLASVAKWSDLADEIIIVDSRSTDGTLEMIRKGLRHPNLRIIERDRGLYASWNEGIAATKGEWIYISTAGDTIERAQLLKLMIEGEKAEADVVVSPCLFVDEGGKPLSGAGDRNPEILRRSAGDSFLFAPPSVRDYIALDAGIRGLLGSCASDLFRGAFLRARPFPTDYGTHGDTAWALRHSHEIRLCVVPVIGSTFCRHAKEREEPAAELADILDRIYAAEIRSGGRLPGLSLSLMVRSWRGRRRYYASTGSPCRGMLATLAWLGLRVVLAVSQIPRKIRLRHAGKPLVSHEK